MLLLLVAMPIGRDRDSVLGFSVERAGRFLLFEVLSGMDWNRRGVGWDSRKGELRRGGLSVGGRCFVLVLGFKGRGAGLWVEWHGDWLGGA